MILFVLICLLLDDRFIKLAQLAMLCLFLLCEIAYPIFLKNSATAKKFEFVPLMMTSVVCAVFHIICFIATIWQLYIWVHVKFKIYYQSSLNFIFKVLISRKATSSSCSRQNWSGSPPEGVKLKTRNICFFCYASEHKLKLITYTS